MPGRAGTYPARCRGFAAGHGVPTWPSATVASWGVRPAWTAAAAAKAWTVATTAAHREALTAQRAGVATAATAARVPVATTRQATSLRSVVDRCPTDCSQTTTTAAAKRSAYEIQY